MSREAFHLLLERYLQNKCSDEEKEIIEKWYGMLDKHDMQNIEPTQINALEQKLWDRIHENIHEDKQGQVIKLKPSTPAKRTLVTIAAAVIGAFILTVGYMFFSVESKKPQFLESSSIVDVSTITNNDKKPLTVKLEDGSLVILQPGASLKYPKHFSKSIREVALEGEGFFEISKNPLQPFLVYNRNVITRVVGTSFIIKTNNPANETEVTVKTGKVIVSPNSGSLSFKVDGLLRSDKGVTLTPNQKTIYRASENTFATTLADIPQPIVSKHKQTIKDSYSFTEARVSDVLKLLQKSYGIEFIVEDKALYNYTFTGDLSGQGLYNQLDFLCESIQATYEIKETKIIIKDKE